MIGGGPLQREPSAEVGLRAALDAGLSEIGAHLSDLGGLDDLGAADLDFDPLGVEFDLSQLEQDPENVGNGTSSPSVAPPVVGLQDGGQNGMAAPADLSAEAGGAVAAVGGVVMGGGEMVRDPSFGISGHAVASTVMASVGGGSTLAGEPLSRQSSLDINTIMQASFCFFLGGGRGEAGDCTRHMLTNRVLNPVVLILCCVSTQWCQLILVVSFYTARTTS